MTRRSTDLSIRGRGGEDGHEVAVRPSVTRTGGKDGHEAGVRPPSLWDGALRATMSVTDSRRASRAHSAVPCALHHVFRPEDMGQWNGWWAEAAATAGYEPEHECAGLKKFRERTGCGKAPETESEFAAWHQGREALVTASVVARLLPAYHVARPRWDRKPGARKSVLVDGTAHMACDRCLTPSAARLCEPCDKESAAENEARKARALAWGSRREGAGLRLARMAVELRRGRPCHGWIRPGLVTSAYYEGMGATPDMAVCIGDDDTGCEVLMLELKCPESRRLRHDEPLPPSIWCQPCYGCVLADEPRCVVAQVFRDGAVVLSEPTNEGGERLLEEGERGIEGVPAAARGVWALGEECVRAARGELQRRRAAASLEGVQFAKKQRVE